MLMEQPGTQSREEKGYTFTTPLEHGLSYNKVNPKRQDFRKIVSDCWKYIEAGIDRGGSKEFINTEYLVKKVLDKESDLWVSEDRGGSIRGCFVIGAAPYPEETGILAESIGGEFDFEVVTPIVEKHYKELGYKFFEMTGRKGWEKVMKPLGYNFMNITMYKRL
jgi:hypothetical protein|tara:strand:+ start:13755 stop:14246 length:492 start_codon:yes stop_codon:yes gene_type:complete